jgi:hypothetical protein
MTIPNDIVVLASLYREPSLGFALVAEEPRTHAAHRLVGYAPRRTMSTTTIAVYVFLGLVAATVLTVVFVIATRPRL